MKKQVSSSYTEPMDKIMDKTLQVTASRNGISANKIILIFNVSSGAQFFTNSLCFMENKVHNIWPEKYNFSKGSSAI